METRKCITLLVYPVTEGSTCFILAFIFSKSNPDFIFAFVLLKSLPSNIRSLNTCLDQTITYLNSHFQFVEKVFNHKHQKEKVTIF